MTNKFKPFDPSTAKNGDSVYGVVSGEPYTYVGPRPNDPKNSVCISHCGNYRTIGNTSLQVLVPKKTVWINVYDYGNVNMGVDAFPYLTKEEADEHIDKNKYFRGTFTIEIDAE